MPPSFKLATLAAALAFSVPYVAVAQTSAAASGPKTRAEVKDETRAARAKGELTPEAKESQIGDPPVPKARAPRKAKAPKKAASAM